MEAPSPSDYRRAARRRLPRPWYDYFAGGAGDEQCVRENRRAFRRLALHYRVLRGTGDSNPRTSLLGRDLELPVLIAPTAFHRLACPEGEPATARAAASAGTVFTLSMASTTGLEEVAAAVAGRGARLWFQIYLQPDRAVTEEMVRRAEAAGYEALVVTIDSPMFGRRERDVRHGFHQLPPGMSLANFTTSSDPTRALEFTPNLSWRDIDWLRETTRLPILLKGIVHPADAELACRHGCDGIVVSNHGGRQLDAAPATLEVLPAIAAVVDRRIALVMDGGVRSGGDVLKALALGADAVALGRPILWGLAAAGEAGATGVLERMKNELTFAMAMCGVRSCAEVGPELVWPRAEPGRDRGGRTWSRP